MRPQRVYTFKHGLTQEAAYNSLLLRRRRELHRRVAQHLEKTNPEWVIDIARHLVEAREHRRALPYLVAAGEGAARAYSTPEAIRFFNQAVAVADPDTDLPLLRTARVLAAAGRTAKAEAQKGAAQAVAGRSPPSFAARIFASGSRRTQRVKRPRAYGSGSSGKSACSTVCVTTR